MIVFAQGGVVDGAYSFVIASYAVTWAFFILYTASLVIRGREDR